MHAIVQLHKQVEQLRTQKAEAEKKLKRFKQDLVDAKRLLKVCACLFALCVRAFGVYVRVVCVCAYVCHVCLCMCVHYCACDQQTWHYVKSWF